MPPRVACRVLRRASRRWPDTLPPSEIVNAAPTSGVFVFGVEINLDAEKNLENFREDRLVANSANNIRFAFIGLRERTGARCGAMPHDAHERRWNTGSCHSTRTKLSMVSVQRY